MARRRTTTNRIVSIRLTSHGTRRNLFSAETPKMCKKLYLIDYNSAFFNICDQEGDVYGYLPAIRNIEENIR